MKSVRLKAADIKLLYAAQPKLLDKWLEAGYAAYVRRQQPKGATAAVRERLKGMSKVEIEQLKLQLKRELKK